jgi:amphi-Trp domain-containing protein
MKRRKIKQTDQRDVQACILQLQAIIEGLKTGTIGIQDAGESVLLTPGGPIEFELRVDQLQRRETIRVEMSWRPEPSAPRSAAPLDSAAALPAAADFPAPQFATKQPPSSDSPPVDGDAPPSTRSLDQLATAEYQRLFAAARVLGSDGQWHIDQDRLIVSLESAGVDALTQQELYTLALQSDADGRASLLSERVIEAIKRVSQPPPASDAGSARHNGGL